LITEIGLIGARVFGHCLRTFTDCMLSQLTSFFFFRFLFLTIFEMFFRAFPAFLTAFPEVFSDITFL